MAVPNIKNIHEIYADKLPGLLGIEILQLEKGSVKARMPVDHRHHQPMGILHGGASLALAETAASIGGWFLVAEAGQVVVGQEINGNHLRQVKSGHLTAEAKAIHQGRTSQVWEINIFDDEQKLICISRCTLAVIIPR